MSRRTRIFLALVAVYVIGMAALLYQLLGDLDPRYRESAEEGLVETAQLLATVIEQDVEQGALPTDRMAGIFRDLYARQFSAQIYSLHKTRVELRAYVTNRHGIVVYDSTGRDFGKDYSSWRDVRYTLRGEFGSRTTRDVPQDPNSSVMYVGAPIRWQGEIVGALAVGKPVQSLGQFVSAARGNIISVGVASAFSVLLLAIVLSFLLIRPLGITSDLLAALRTAWWRDAAGQRHFSPRRAWRALRAQTRAAAQEVRDAIAGRNYVQEYVEQLTHELKSPISAIRGAAELLQEPDMPAEQRQRFTSSIARETHRLQEVVDRMMELSSLESRRLLKDQQAVELAPLLHELAGIARTQAPALKVEVHIRTELTVEGDPFLLRRAIGNLLDNAVGFSTPGNGAGPDIVLRLAREGRMARIEVRDRGPGVPVFAQGKVFEKFFSLARPGSGKRSTGLGLAFVREIAALHQGSITLGNADDAPGALAVLRLPLLKG
ncbi:two-component system sensor histidine kinase CreC [Ottowia thiooxydans]|uniref:histidine kinase n=1 Tax=Ottowia thiooxydans TaxID=219182 RepID=A0ABV2Q6M8_9BURK